MSEHTPQQVLRTPDAGFAAEDVAAVHAYASAFCGRPATAADLATAVLTAQQGPATRPALLADVRRTAFGWLRDGRSAVLRPGFRDWAQRAGESFGTTDTLRHVEHDSLLLRAFGELAEQSRAALWLCQAEAEPAFAARVLNTSEEFAESMAEAARARLADTFLRLRAEHTTDARCVHYGGMLGAIARGTHRETPPDLERHLESCEFCAHDIALLRTLTSGDAAELRPLLVDRLLVWGGPAYRSARPPTPTPLTVPGLGLGRTDGGHAKPGGPRMGSWAKAALRGRGKGKGSAGSASGAEPRPTSGTAQPPRTEPEQPVPDTTASPSPSPTAPETPTAPTTPAPPAFLTTPTPPGTTPTPPRTTTPAPRRPVLPLAAAVVVTAVASAVTLNLLSDTGTGTAVDSYGPPPSASRPSSAAPSPTTAPGTVLATVALKSAADPGSCVTATPGSSPDNAPVPAACAGGATQQWRVVAVGQGAVDLQHVASTFCLDIAGYRAPGDPMQMRPCAYQQGDSAPYPEDQAFVVETHRDKTFTLVCQDNPDIAVGIRDGEIRMLSAGTGSKAIRFALDDALSEALGN
ncbi:RICIN domain-containing protein [Streptomyces sp. SID13726]|uniref:RICIN domain-containing protein n=1 Tax=Streptomyces sp. SID13726 TaxID=2706058 RepID=UPI0013BDA005|nr:RICIN domain-containing protein [Streptomyces sp. SID13726]NEB04690.1 hypothetical protein [Streptomyces sp. SID13726]